MGGGREDEVLPQVINKLCRQNGCSIIMSFNFNLLFFFVAGYDCS